MAYQYITCPSCHIGGYDFCDYCLGAGGFTTEIVDVLYVPTSQVEKTLGTIRRFLDKISVHGLGNELIKKSFNSHFEILMNSPISSESVSLLKRMHTIRKKFVHKMAINSLKEKISQLPKLVLVSTGDAGEHLLDYDTISLGKILNNPNAYRFVPIDNPYFDYEQGKGIVAVVKIKRIAFNFELFEKLVEYIRSKAQILIDTEEIQCNSDFLQNLKNPPDRFKVRRFDYYGPKRVRSFLIEDSLILPAIIEFVNGLQKANTPGWIIL